MSKFLLSVIIPALNEEKHLGACLKSLKKQTYKGLVNIIVSDNGSTDKTIEVAKKYDCHIVTGSKKGSIALARIFGANKAKELAKLNPGSEEIIISTDADTLLDKNYFQAVVKKFKNPKIAAATGPLGIKHKHIPFKELGKQIIKLQYLTLVLILKLPWLIEKIWDNGYLFGANTCIRRSVYEKVGGWDKRFHKPEDLSLTLAVLKHNYKIHYLPELKVFSSIRKFINVRGNLDLKNIYHYYLKDKTMMKGFKLARKVFR